MLHHLRKCKGVWGRGSELLRVPLQPARGQRFFVPFMLNVQRPSKHVQKWLTRPRPSLCLPGGKPPCCPASPTPHASWIMACFILLATPHVCAPPSCSGAGAAAGSSPDPHTASPTTPGSDADRRRLAGMARKVSAPVSYGEYLKVPEVCVATGEFSSAASVAAARVHRACVVAVAWGTQV